MRCAIFEIHPSHFTMSHILRRAVLPALLVVGSVQAQFPLVNTSNMSVRSLHSLGSGLRLITLFNGDEEELTIYELDYSVHRVLTIPDAPPGMVWANMTYVTEDLFDTDPSTIEFALTAMQENGPGDFALFIYREDGTELFQQDPGSFISGGGIGVNASTPIFTSGGQTYMLVYTNAVLGPPTNIYELPGSLPCIDCRGNSDPTGLVTGGVDEVESSSGIRIFPNPAQEHLVVVLGQEQLGPRTLRLFDGGGHLALERTFLAAERVELPIGPLAAGTYLCHILAGGQLLEVLPVVLER